MFYASREIRSGGIDALCTEITWHFGRCFDVGFSILRAFRYWMGRIKDKRISQVNRLLLRLSLIFAFHERAFSHFGPPVHS